MPQVTHLQAISAFKTVFYISGSLIFAIVQWLSFVAMSVRAFVFYLPWLNDFGAAEALGR